MENFENPIHSVLAGESVVVGEFALESYQAACIPICSTINMEQFDLSFEEAEEKATDDVSKEFIRISMSTQEKYPEEKQLFFVLYSCGDELKIQVLTFLPPMNDLKTAFPKLVEIDKHNQFEEKFKDYIQDAPKPASLIEVVPNRDMLYDMLQNFTLGDALIVVQNKGVVLTESIDVLLSLADMPNRDKIQVKNKIIKDHGKVNYVVFRWVSDRLYVLSVEDLKSVENVGILFSKCFYLSYFDDILKVHFKRAVKMVNVQH